MNKTHATRDHRFAYISTGDLTKWAKGTTRAVYPEPKRIKPTSVPIQDLEACVLKPIQARETVEEPVMVGSTPRAQASTMASKTDAMDVASFSSFAASIFETLGKRKSP